MTAKFIVTFLIVSGSFGITTAQNFFEPEFKPLTDVVDFGEADSKTDPGFRILKFKNDGGSPLTITNVVGSCSCTVGDWPKEPIKPGETAQIKVNYKMSNIGLINKTVTITTNEPNGKDANGTILYKQHVIKVQGNVK